ncbi:MAG: tyrosine-type recombinase/integrase, partial [Oscillospiraceae bacterium]|nr:tyrosine-type recombinase/integrase [Oscillospiraceae bacterium]
YSILICYSEIPIDIDINPNRLVCCRSDGRPITSGMLNKIFKQILKDAELPNVRFHDLRHTYATILLKKHIPAKIVSNMLGHSSIGITMDTYSHVMTEMQDSAIDAVDTLFPL